MRIETRCVLAPLVAAFAMAMPTSAVAAPDLFRHDLGLVDGHLRIAIEYAPEELGESLRTAEVVCRLGEGSASRQETDMASAD
ncbi:MAG: hypothetical protein J0H06_06160 [Actinobacteria bacterium]|nr:hypothetical protein [Actinomycetota bacterium]